MDRPLAAAPDALQQALEVTRQNFATTFIGQCGSIRTLIDESATAGGEASRAELAQVIHRMRGLAGTIGFPAVSARAAEFEEFIDQGAGGVFDAGRARRSVDGLQAAFTHDVDSATARAAATVAPVQGAKILLAEDDADQRDVMSAFLETAGYVPIAVGAGDLVMNAVRAERPALILLDIEMPGLDGYSVCRQLKADPELAGIPVIFATARATLDDKIAGLTLGADEYLAKPIDLRELILRIQLLLKRTRAGDPRGTPAVQAPAEPSLQATAARGGTVVVAEDDPEVVRIVDAQVRAAGYTAIAAANGEQALAAVRAHAPDVLVLDLMMPKLNGFDVLARLREGAGAAPRVLVLSGRGREQDVLRAFELGADDYMTKPFNPQELMARLDRLFRKAGTPASHAA